MVSIFVGSGAGFARGSGNILGGGGLLGSGSQGRSGETVSVNAATGNLLISQQDDFLIGRGPDAGISRTYNSLAQMSDGDNSDQWQQSTLRRIFGLTGTLNTAGSTVSRQSGDGSVIVYTWNAAQSAYVTTDGDGAHDRLAKSGATWVWTDGASQMTETYEASVADTAIFRIRELADTDGNKLSFTYLLGTDKLDRVTTANHGTVSAATGIAEQSYVQYIWSGNNITEIVTGYTDYASVGTEADNVNKTLTRTRYAYDGSNRLITVTVDLSPDDNSIADGKTYVTSYTYDGSSKRVASITQTDGSSLAIAYDTSCRVSTLTQTVAAGDTRVTSLSYGANYTNVTGPDGQVTRLDYVTSTSTAGIGTWAVGGTGSINKEAATIGGVHATKFTQLPGNDSGIYYSGTVSAGEKVTFDITLQAVGSATTQMLGLLGGTSHGGAAHESAARIVSGPGQIEYTAAGEWTVTGLSASEGTRIQIIRAFASNDTYTASLAVGVSGATAGSSVIAAAAEPFKSASASIEQIDPAQWTEETGWNGVVEGVLGQVTPSPGVRQYTLLSEGALSGVSTALPNVGFGDTITFTTYLKAGDPDTSVVIAFADPSESVRARIISGPGTAIIEDYGTTRIIGLSNSSPTLIEFTATITNEFSPFDGSRLVFFFDGSMNFRAGATVTVGSPLLVKWPEASPYPSMPPVTSVQLTKITAPPASSGATPQTMQFGYDADGNVTSVTDAAGKVTSYTYDANGNLLTSTDANGNVVTRSYGAKNELLTETRTGSDASSTSTSHTTRYVYDSENHLRYLISAEGRVTEYRYSPEGQLQVDIEYPEHGYSVGSGAPSEATMDAWRNAITDRQSVKTAIYSYDARGNLTNVVKYGYADAVGGGLTSEGYTHRFWTYDQAGRLLARQTAPQSGETFLYDGLGRLVGSTDMAGGTTTIVFNDAALTTTVMTAAGFTTVSSYNKTGDLVGTTDSGFHVTGGTSAYLYDKNGRVRTATDASGYKTYFLYDKAGRKVAEIDHYGYVTEYRYDTAGRLAATARFTNVLATGQLTALVAPDNLLEMGDIRPAAHAYDIWSWSIYDDAGRLIQSIDGSGGVAVFSYDASNRLVKTNSYYNKLSAAQMAAFRTAAPTTPVLPAADSRDTVSRSFYDRDGRLIGALDGEGYLSEIVYDKAGQKVEEIAYATRADPAFRTDGTFDQLRVTVSPASTVNRRNHHVYDGQGLLRFGIDNAGYVTEYIYKSEVEWGAIGLVRSTVSHAIAISTNDFTYDNVKALVGANVSHAANRASWSVYDAAGRLAYATDTDGAVTGFTYDVMGNVVKTVAFAAKRATASLPTQADMDGWRDANIGNAANRITRNWYSARGELRYVVDSEGFITRFDYDAEGHLGGEFRWNTAYAISDGTSADAIYGLLYGDAGYVGKWYSYDEGGNRVATRIVDANGLTGSELVDVRDYYANGLLGHVFGGYGTVDQNLTLYVYDGAGRLTAEYKAYGEPEQAATFYSYDGLGNLLSVTDPRGKVTSYTYDERGLVLTKTDAAGGVTSYEYNAFGEVVKMTDPRGAVTYSYYDERGRIVLQRDAEDYVTETSYTRFGEVATVTRRYNPTSSPTSTTNPPTVAAHAQDATTSFEYDKRGLVTKTTDAEGYFESYGYDAFGNRTSVVAKSKDGGKVAGGTTTYVYDRRGLLVRETLPVTSYDKDGNALLSSVTGGYDVSTTYAYDARGNRVQMVEAAGLPEARTTSFVYDKANRLTETRMDVLRVVPSSGLNIVETRIDRISYDARGNVTSTIDGAGGRTVYFYDDLGRVVITINAVGTYSAHAYDANGNITTTTVYGTAVTIPTDGGAKEEKPTVPSGESRVTSFTYDNLNRLLTSSVVGVNSYVASGASYALQATNVHTAYEYDANGNVIKATDANGNASFSYYDKLGRKTAAVDAGGYLTTWSYDGEGNVLVERRHTTRFTGSPTTASLPGVSTSGADRVSQYSYDRNGNRTIEQRLDVLAHNGSGGASNVHATLYFQYNGLGQVVRKYEATGEDIQYLYDSAGRVGREIRSAFTSHQGTSVTPTIDYLYNGLGDLARTVAAGAGDAAARVTRYQYGTGGVLEWVQDASGQTVYHYQDIAGRNPGTYTIHQRSDGTTIASRAYSLQDYLGRVTETVSYYYDYATGWDWGVPYRNTYNAYGEVVATTVNGATSGENLYDGAGRLTATTSGDGIWKHFGYDANGNQTIAITSAGTSLAGLSFDQALALVGQENVNATYTVYDARNMATSVTEEQRRLSSGNVQNLTSSRSYNAFGEAISETNANLATTTYSYNNIGRMIRSEGPAVQMTRENGATLWIRAAQDFYYDASGRLVATRDANGDYGDNSGNSQSNPASKTAHTGALTRLTLLTGTGYGGSEALVTTQTAADGGVKQTRYDIHGDARTLVDEVGRTTTQLFDGMGRVTQISHAGGLVDSYAYDGLGQRIKHWNNFLGTGDVETTDYDTQGRVIKTRAFGGDITTTSYTWDASITAAGMGVTSGGWTQVTTMANGRTLTEKNDILGRATWKQDLGGNVTTYAYDIAGRQISSTMGGLTATFTYFNTGQIATNSGPNGTATYGYDANGNRLTELLVNGGVTIKNQTATYDAMGRLATWNEAGTAKSPAASTINSYDANGNIRRTQVSTHLLNETGNPYTGAATGGYWYRYDSMNRLVTDKGQLSGTAGASGTMIVRGINNDNATQTGRDIIYDAAGQRVSVATTFRKHGEFTTPPLGPDLQPIPGMWEIVYIPGWWQENRENYSYDAAGRLTEVHNASGSTVQETDIITVEPPALLPAAPATGGSLRSSLGYDLMGRLTSQEDRGWAQGSSFIGVIFSRSIAYNAKGQVTSDVASTVKARYGNNLYDTFRSATTYSYGSGAAYALGSVVSQTAVNTKLAYNGSGWSSQPGTLTSTTYTWYDGAVQDLVTYDYDTGSNSNPIYTTDLQLNAFGQLTGAAVNDGIPKTVAYTLDEAGQIIRRDESRNSAPSQGAPHEVFYRFAGRQIGMTGNNGTADINYTKSVEERSAARPEPTSTDAGLFRNGTRTTPGTYNDFSLSYDPYNSGYQGSAGGGYTVRTGDTLASIAAGLWGDANLWYKLAEANGLSGQASLIEGQTLNLPTGVSRSSHNASTFKPYDPTDAIGDLSPTTPKPPKKPKCGGFGMILVAAIAIGLSAWLGPQMIAAAQGMLAGSTAVATAAAGGAALSSAALVGGGIIGGAAVGAFASAVSQGVGVAIGAQNSFSWKGVGLAAIAGGISGGISGLSSGVNAAGQIVPGTAKLGGIGGFLSRGGVTSAIARGVTTNALTQGIGVATKLQSKFDFAGVAAAGISAGASQFAGARTTGFGPFGNDVIANAASGIANAATRSAINGNSFGDNLRDAIPDIIGQTIGNMVAGGLRNPTEQSGNSTNTTAEAAADGIVGGHFGLHDLSDGERSTNATSYASGAAGDNAGYDGPPIVVTGDWITSRLLPQTTDYQFAWYRQQMGDSTLGMRARYFAQKALSQYPKVQVGPPSHDDPLAAAILASGGNPLGPYRSSGSNRISAPGWLDTVSSYSPLPFNRMYEDVANLPRDIRRNGLDWFLRDQPVTLGGGAVSVTTGAASATSALVGGMRNLLPKVAEGGAARVTVFRVEGAPNARFAIDDVGNVALEPGNKTVWLNFGQEGRAMSYLDRKVADGLPGAQLKSFEIDARFLDEIRSTAVPESLARRNPGAPIISRDPYPDQFGLRPDQFQRLMESVFQGTGKNVRPR